MMNCWKVIYDKKLLYSCFHVFLVLTYTSSFSCEGLLSLPPFNQINALIDLTLKDKATLQTTFIFCMVLISEVVMNAPCNGKKR